MSVKPLLTSAWDVIEATETFPQVCSQCFCTSKYLRDNTVKIVRFTACTMLLNRVASSQPRGLMVSRKTFTFKNTSLFLSKNHKVTGIHARIKVLLF